MRLLSLTSLVCAALLSAGTAFAQTPFSGVTVPLIAGQNTVIGDVRCALVPTSDTRGSCIAQTTGGWCLSLVHLYVGRSDPTGMAPGQFPFRTDPGSCASTVAVDFTLPTACVGEPFKVALHAEARLPSRQQAETAWGKGVSTGQNWSMAFSFPCRPIDN